MMRAYSGTGSLFHNVTDSRAAMTNAVPASKELLVRAAERGSNIRSMTLALIQLLDRFGAAELQAAIEESLAHDSPHQHSVRLVLEKRREARREPPPVVVALPEH